jgi:hypothetical protein
LFKRDITFSMRGGSSSLGLFTRDVISVPNPDPYYSQSLALDLQTLVILEELGVPKVSVAIVAGKPSVVRDARRNSRASFAQRVAIVLRASPIPLVTRGAYIFFCHSRRQVYDDVIMLTITQQVDPLRYCHIANQNTPLSNTPTHDAEKFVV